MLIFAVLTVLAVWVGGILLCYLTSDSDDIIVINDIIVLVERLTKFINVIVECILAPVTIVMSLPWIWLLRIGVLSFLGIMVHEAPSTLLEALDRLWRSIVYPAMKIGVLNVLMTFKFVFGTFAPLYNMAVVIVSQLRSGTIGLAGECSVNNLMGGAKLGTTAFVGFLSVTTNWANPLTPSPIVVRELNITEPLWNLQQAISLQSDTAKCMCEALNDPWEVLFQTTRSPSLARGVNAGFNTVLSLFQQGVAVMPPYMMIPDFYRTFKYSKDVFTHFGQWMDDIVIKSTEVIVKKSLDTPKTFVFGTVAHIPKAFIEVTSVGVSTVAHIIVPSKLTNSTYMMRVTSLQYVFQELDYAVDGTADIITWLMNSVSRSLADVSTSDDPILIDIQSQAAGDVIRWSLRAVLGIPNVFLGLLNEITWKSFFNNEQNIIKTLQSYDGKWGEVFSMSGRPTLNKNVFNPAELMLDALFEFIPSIFSPLKSVIRIPLQFVRIFIRTLFAGDQIVSGDFFDRPIDCNYGLEWSCGKNYTGAAACDSTGGNCECNPAISMENCQCMFTFPDDVMPSSMESFYANSDKWCNSLLYEFIFKEIDNLQQGIGDMLLKIQSEQCESSEIEFPEMCPSGVVSSNTKTLCAASTSLSRVTRLPLNIYRQVYAVLMTSIFGYRQRHFDIDSRLCEFSNLMYGGLGVLPLPYKEKMMNAIYALLRLSSETVRSGKYVNDFVGDIGKDDIDWEIRIEKIPCKGCSRVSMSASSEFTGKLLKLIVVELQVFFGYFITLFDTLGELFDSINDGYGIFFRGVEAILVALKNSLSQPLIDFIGMLLRLTVDFLDFLGSGNIGSGMLDRVVTLFLKFTELIANVSTRILAGFLKMLGPFGQFLTTVVVSFCETLQGAFKFLKVDIDLSTCSSLDDLGAQETHHQMMPDIFKMGWNGTSECDYMVHAYKHYKWGDMRPVEQIMIEQCIDHRALAIKIGEISGAELPFDMFYNWKRKYEMAYHGVMGAIIYYKHKSASTMMSEWNSHGIPMYWIPIFSQTVQAISGISASDIIHEIHHGMGNEPEVGILVNIFDETMQLASDTRKIWIEHNMTHSWKNPMNITYTFGSELITSMVPQIKIVADPQYAWGLNTSTDGTCPLLSNFIETVEEQSQVTMDYYTNVYAAVTVPHFVNWLEGRDPWVKDFIEVMDEAIGSALDKFKKQFFIQSGKMLSPIGYVSFDIVFKPPSLGGFWTGPTWHPGFIFPDAPEPRIPTLSDFDFDLGTISLPKLSGSLSFNLEDLPNPFDINPELNTEGFSSNPRYDDPSLLETEGKCNFDNVVFPENITDALYCFVTEDGNTKVPYFGHNLKYVIDYQFKTCSISQITCNKSTSVRMESMLDALWYCFITILVCTALQILTGIPTMMFIPILPIFALIILTTTWNWTLACYPNVPPCFADDLYAFVQTYLIPNCFCSYFPALSNECYPGFCHFVSGTTSFSTCSQIPEFGYLWVSFYYAKKYIPTVLKWLHYVIYKDSTFTAWMSTLDSPVTAIEQDCAQLHILDLSYPIAFALVALFILPPLISIGIKLIFTCINLILSLLSLLYSTCLSLDKSTLKTSIPITEVLAESLLPTNTIKETVRQENVDRKDTNMVRLPTTVGTRKRLRFRGN